MSRLNNANFFLGLYLVVLAAIALVIGLLANRFVPILIIIAPSAFVGGVISFWESTIIAYDPKRFPIVEPALFRAALGFGLVGFILTLLSFLVSLEVSLFAICFLFNLLAAASALIAAGSSHDS